MHYVDIIHQAYEDALTKTAAAASAEAAAAPADAAKKAPDEGVIKRFFAAPGRGIRELTREAATAELADDASGFKHIKKGVAKGLQGAHLPHVIGLGGSAAALGAAGYGAKKYYDYKNNQMKYASEGEDLMYFNPYLSKHASKADMRKRILENAEQTKKGVGKGFSNMGNVNYSLEDYKAARDFVEEQAGKKQRVIGRTGGDNLSPWYKRPGEGIMRHGNRMGTRGAFNGGILGGAQRGYGAVVGNKYVAHAALPAALAAGAGAGAYYYNKNKKTKAAADDEKMLDKAKRHYSKYSGANYLMERGGEMAANNPKGSGYWAAVKRGAGKTMGNKYVAHGALPAALAAGTGAGAYYYNKRRKSKSAALEAELFNEALMDINYETALLDEIDAWKEANYYGY